MSSCPAGYLTGPTLIDILLTSRAFLHGGCSEGQITLRTSIGAFEPAFHPEPSQSEYYEHRDPEPISHVSGPYPVRRNGEGQASE
jgi:hypothetical protein